MINKPETKTKKKIGVFCSKNLNVLQKKKNRKFNYHEINMCLPLVIITVMFHSTTVILRYVKLCNRWFVASPWSPSSYFWSWFCPSAFLWSFPSVGTGRKWTSVCYNLGLSVLMLSVSHSSGSCKILCTSL